MRFDYIRDWLVFLDRVVRLLAYFIAYYRDYVTGFFGVIRDSAHGRDVTCDLYVFLCDFGIVCLCVIRNFVERGSPVNVYYVTGGRGILYVFYGSVLVSIGGFGFLVPRGF